MNEQKIAEICKALSDSNRIKIIKNLEHGELCACELLKVLNISQPTLSHHMKVLCRSDLVKARKAGRWSHYSLNCVTISEFKKFISTLECCKIN